MQPPSAIVIAGTQTIAAQFGSFQRLSVRQRKRWTEILLSIDTRNQYDVYDEYGQPVLTVAEDGHGILATLKRLILGPIRPFTSTVTDRRTGRECLELRRPFRFIFHRLEVSGPDGTPLGAVQKRWSWIRRLYTIENGQGQAVAELFGPILRPWTFEVRVYDQPVAMIQKKWSGLGREMFTAADNFGVDFGTLDPSLRALAFAATVLIDVVHFERSQNN